MSPDPAPRSSGLRLIASRRYGPLFLSQLLGVLADNIAKSAIAVLMIFGAGGTPAMAALATALFVLPYVLFAPVAGRVSDRFPKYRVVRMVKLAEVPTMAFAGAAMWSADARLMLAAMFLAGLQATFFSPVKYAILPELVNHADLVGANAQIESGTFLAILLGTIGGGVLGGWGASPLMAWLLPAISAAGVIAAFLIPRTTLADPTLSLPLMPFAGTAGLLQRLRGWRRAHAAAVALSWFWMGGAILLAEIPTYASGVLHQGATAGAILLAALALGIGAGSTAYGLIAGNRNAGAAIPLGFMGMGGLTAVAALIPGTEASAVAIGGACLFGAAFCGGLLSVPLYVALQEGAPAHGRAQAVSGSNLLNAIYMALGSAAAAAVGFLSGPLGLSDDQSVRVVLLIGAAGLSFAAIPACLTIPEAALAVLGRLLLWMYRVEVKGLENLEAAGPAAVIAPNHVSWIDGALMAAALPGRPEFAVDTQIARTWWARWAIGLVDALSIDPANPMAIKTLVRHVRGGKHVVIFPEGRLTRTGGLMKIYDGLALVADLSDAPVVPIRIEGARATIWTKLGGLYRRRLFPRITVMVLPPTRLVVPEHLAGTARREALALALYDIMSDAAFHGFDAGRTLFGALIGAAREHGDRCIVQDRAGGALTYQALIRDALLLGRALAAQTKPGERVGVMLPGLGVTAAAFFGLQAFGRVPTMIDPAQGVDEAMREARVAGIGTIVMARGPAAAKLCTAAEGSGAAFVIRYIEDIVAGIGRRDRLIALRDRIFIDRIVSRGPAGDDPAVILFTGGTEGAPKAVALSHRNLLANVGQAAARIVFNPADVVLNALPLSESLGLTAGLLLPVISGVKTVLCPDPANHRKAPEAAYDCDATILLAADRFLAGCAESANPYDFHTLRSVFAGGERVRPETRRIWAEKFGVRILEAYGATEAGPLLAINTPMHARTGTVGRLLPGITARLEPMDGVAKGGRLMVRGPNVMLGYIDEDRPGFARLSPDGWHDTGDVVAIDPAGFVTVLGRAGRFAKVAGVTVSLRAVEDLARGLWPSDRHAAVALPDPRRGARIVLVSTRAGAIRADLAAYLHGRDLPEAASPAEIVFVTEMPVIAAGRLDYAAILDIARRPRISEVA